MQSSSSYFDVSQFKSLFEQAPTTENGWTLTHTHEGEPGKTTPGSDIKAKFYKKQVTGGTALISRAEAILKGETIDSRTIDNIVLMNRDLSYKLKWKKDAPKKLKLIEQTSPNTDVIYTELHFPFPMSNRDLVHKRFFAGNKEDAELVKQLGLPERSHRYYLILIESAERPEYPEKSKPIRGKTTMNYMMLEEVENDKTAIKVTMFICQDLRLPEATNKALEEGIGIFAILGLMVDYAKTFGDAKK